MSHKTSIAHIYNHKNVGYVRPLRNSSNYTRDTLNHNESVPIRIIIVAETKNKKENSCMDNNMKVSSLSYLIQRGAGEDISSEEGWLQALGTLALTKKEEGKMLIRKLGSKSFDL